jgi:mycoredoxin-dependent peroxiredoxin
LERLEERRVKLESKGATLTAISVDPVEKSRALASRLGIQFPLLSDPGGEVARAYGVWHAEKEIALPAVFVIDRRGAIRWKRVSASLNDRPPEDDIVEAVDALSRSVR